MLPKALFATAFRFAGAMPRVAVGYAVGCGEVGPSVGLGSNVGDGCNGGDGDGCNVGSGDGSDAGVGCFVAIDDNNVISV